jgi:hypothetical protein
VGKILLAAALVVIIAKLAKGILKSILMVGCILLLLYLVYPYMAVYF